MVSDTLECRAARVVMSDAHCQQPELCIKILLNVKRSSPGISLLHPRGKLLFNNTARTRFVM